MKKLILNSTKDVIQKLEELNPSITFFVGSYYRKDYLEINKEYVLPDTATFHIQPHNGSGLALQVALTEEKNNLKLETVNKNLWLLRNNNKPIIYIATREGVFDIPGDFSGLIVLNLTYEKKFPEFACLPNVSGLFITGGYDLKEWDNLKLAGKLDILGFEANNSKWTPHLSARPKILYCLGDAFEKIDDYLLHDCTDLILISGSKSIFQKAMKLPCLKEIFISASFTPVAISDLKKEILECATLIDPVFPSSMDQFKEGESRNYSVYMSNINESSKFYGTPEKGLEIIDTDEVSGDYPMEFRKYVEYNVYGISDFGSLYIKRTNDFEWIDLKLSTSREKALHVLSKLSGIPDKISKYIYIPAIAKEQTVSLEKNKIFVDENKIRFLEKSAQFQLLLETLILPVFKDAAKVLKAFNVETKVVCEIEDDKDPSRYRASVWFQMYNEDRSKWGTFQFGQTGAKLDPIWMSTWNPSKWKGHDQKIRLEKITDSFLKDELNRFLSSLQHFFKYKWSEDV